MPFATSFLQRQLLSDLPQPIGSFKGKTVIVTGSNTGLGLEACRWIVRLGASHVILACRNIAKGDVAAKDIKTLTGCSTGILDVWELDMASYASVQAFAYREKTELPRLDVLIANAGINSHEFCMMEDNEAMVTVNCVSLFLLGFLLLPTLRNTASKNNIQTYFTITSSDLHEIARFDERRAPPGQIFAALNDKARFPGRDRYATSKLLEISIVRELAAFLPLDSNNVIINCVSPGMCHSELTRDFSSVMVRFVQKLIARRTEVGARAIVYGASVGVAGHGQYIPDCRIDTPKAVCQRPDADKIQHSLWLELKVKLDSIQPGVTNLLYN